MHILIVGSGIREYSLAKYLSKFAEADIIFVAPGNEKIKEIAACIDIAANNVNEIIDFAKANMIDLTITFDEKAIAAGIADSFNEANLTIFAPVRDAAKIALSKSSGKKFMYKTKILTPKFVVADKEKTAIDYLRNAKFPVVIKGDRISSSSTVICNSFSQAKRVAELRFLAEDE